MQRSFRNLSVVPKMKQFSFLFPLPIVIIYAHHIKNLLERYLIKKKTLIKK